MKEIIKSIDWLKILIAIAATTWERIIPRTNLGIFFVIILVYVLIDLRDYFRERKKT